MTEKSKKMQRIICIISQIISIALAAIALFSVGNLDRGNTENAEALGPALVLVVFLPIFLITLATALLPLLFSVLSHVLYGRRACKVFAGFGAVFNVVIAFAYVIMCIVSLNLCARFDGWAFFTLAAYVVGTLAQLYSCFTNIMTARAELLF